MAAKVTFNGVVLMNQGEGVFTPVIGDFGAPRMAVQYAQASAVMFKDLASLGAPHHLELRFYAVDLATIRARIQQAYDSGEGSLVMTGFDTINNCVMMGLPQYSAPGYSETITGSASGVKFRVSIEILQTRR